MLVKQGVDLHTSTFNQALAAEYIAGGYLERHLPNILRIYRPRQEAMLAAMDRLPLLEQAQLLTQWAGLYEVTPDEQAILDGKEGPEKAKLMKILVRFGETFGATKLVDLGGAPHSNLYIGAPYLASLIDMLQQCAEAGLKSYAPYTVNPRPYDVYNVQNNAKDMTMIYEGYSLQWDLDYVHVRLGAPDLNYRTCACYLEEVGRSGLEIASGRFQAMMEVNLNNSGPVTLIIDSHK